MEKVIAEWAGYCGETTRDKKPDGTIKETKHHKIWACCTDEGLVIARHGPAKQPLDLQERVLDRKASLEDALEQAEGDVWVIGGATIYEQALPHADRVVRTRLHLQVEGDCRAPVLDSAWTMVGRDPESGLHKSADGVEYCIATLVRDGKTGFDWPLSRALANFFKVNGHPADARIGRVTPNGWSILQLQGILSGTLQPLSFAIVAGFLGAAWFVAVRNIRRPA